MYVSGCSYKLCEFMCPASVCHYSVVGADALWHSVLIRWGYYTHNTDPNVALN